MIASLVAWLASCASCHPAQASAFEASRHAFASELAVFRVSWAEARTRWCASCHRPEGARTAGLACTTCHADANTDPSDACVRCHEFKTPLPGHFDPVVYSAQPLQSTVSELARHDPAARCADCHDVHRASGGHDPELVRRAVAFEARRTADGVELRVTAQSVGHQFPTGDPFRRLVITVCDDDACAEPIARETIGRGFRMVKGVWAPVIDRTLRDGETRVLRFPPSRRWRATLYYADPKLERGLPAGDVALEVAAGAVP
ncbi:MAG TPA: cytochrome c3 family protein [Kofleriaceae bacterium]|nr:cytochrome c3 family protein [Kofleriaceae bacterium]